MYEATARVYYYCNKLSHDNVSGIVFTASGANVFQIVHVSFESGKITFNVSGIHIIHIKDGHKGPPKTLHFDERGGLRDVDIVNTENTSNERVHINAFHLINITVES